MIIPISNVISKFMFMTVMAMITITPVAIATTKTTTKITPDTTTIMK